jgi:hypothetical protein
LTLALKQQPINIELIQQHRTVGVSEIRREQLESRIFQYLIERSLHMQESKVLKEKKSNISVKTMTFFHT